MTRARSKLAVVGTLCGALLLCASGGSARADDLEVAKQKKLWELGLYGGLFISPGDHDLMDPETTGTYSQFKTLSLELGLRLAYLPRAWLGIELEGGIMPSKTEAGGSALLYHARAHLLVQYPARISPFVVAGVGLLGVSSDSNVLGNDVDPEFHWGIGAKAYLTRWLALRVDLRHVISDGGDRADTGIGHNAFEALLGVSIVLGWKSSPKDRDGDGVTDDKDKCPDVPAKTADGCPPPDTDGDGIPDDKDKCPKVAAKTADGCPVPDTDGDGIPDDKDKCPKVAAKTADGCPPKDTDGDGITDDKDKCPKVAAKTADGCPPPDTDGDGIPDDKDKCPKEPETKNGYQDDDGCPDTVPKIVKKFTGAIRGIYFAVNKAKIRPASFKTLNKAAKVLEKYPALKLIIRGHTDNTGKKDHNMKLSRERAEAVKAYLVKKGIDAGRLQAVGVGPNEPVADNKTRKGRAKNRRIEFKLGG